MKLIKQYCYLDDQNDFSEIGIKKFIEKQAKTCYQSTHTITENSYEKFIQRMIDSDHSRTLEMGTVHLKMSRPIFTSFMWCLSLSKDFSSQWLQWNSGKEYIYITTNYRYFLRLKNMFDESNFLIFKNMFDGLNFKFINYFTTEDNELFPKRHTIHFITDRVTMDSFRTHVGMSSLAESTRYCRYANDKFGNELTYIIPNWIDIPESEYQFIGGFWCNDKEVPLFEKSNPIINNYLFGLQRAESTYMILLQQGWKAEQARQILPLSVKSELVLCGFDDCWDNFLYRRNDVHAHPMAHELAGKVKELLNK